MLRCSLKTLQYSHTAYRSPIQLSPPPPPISAPRCTEAQSRMEQSCVRWQWHPSHAMNNQWTPSGAYNRGAQLQSLTPVCLSLPNSQSLTFGQFLPPVPSLFLSHFSHTYYHYTASVLLCLIISCFSPSTSLCPVYPHHHSACSSLASLTGESWYPSF